MKTSTERDMDIAALEGGAAAEKVYGEWLIEFLGDRAKPKPPKKGANANTPNQLQQPGGGLSEGRAY